MNTSNVKMIFGLVKHSQSLTNLLEQNRNIQVTIPHLPIQCCIARERMFTASLV